MSHAKHILKSPPTPNSRSWERLLSVHYADFESHLVHFCNTCQPWMRQAQEKKNWITVQKHLVCKYCFLPSPHNCERKSSANKNFNFTCHSSHFIFHAIDLNKSSFMKMADKTLGNTTFYTSEGIIFSYCRILTSRNEKTIWRNITIMCCRTTTISQPHSRNTVEGKILIVLYKFIVILLFFFLNGSLIIICAR